MLLDSINYTTKSFTKIHRRTAQSVFESLVTVGDKTTSLTGDHYPTPPPLLMARAYAETSLSFLRGSRPDIEVREAENPPQRKGRKKKKKLGTPILPSLLRCFV